MESIKIEKGEIIVGSDKVTILDNAKRERTMRLISSIIWTFYGAISVFRYFKGQDEFLLWSGLIIGISHLSLGLYTLFFISSNSIIKRDSIVSIKRKTRFGNEFIALKLKNGRIRKISQMGGNADAIVEMVK